MADDVKVRYLESGEGEPSVAKDRLDLLRHVLRQEATWAGPPRGTSGDLVEMGGATEEVEVGPRPRRFVLALVAALGLTALIVGVTSRPAPDDEVVAMMVGTELAPEAEGTARLRETPSGWYIRLEVSGLPPAPVDSYYEGWVWDRGEGVSIGTFHLRGGNEPVALWSGVDVADYPTIWVTLQDEGGGAETSDRLMMTGEASFGD
jgi:hypothetical protein